MGSIWDVVVVGAGVEGSSAAYALAKQGIRVLLLEQFPLPHSRGSSHGQSRTLRKAYDQPQYTSMMLRAQPLWHQLEQEDGTRLFRNTGHLMTSRSRSKVDKHAESLATHGLPHAKLSHQEFQHNYGHFLVIKEGQTAVFDPQGGLLCADKCLQALQRQFVRLGGVIRDGEPVLEVRPGAPIGIRTSKETLQAHKLLLCLGPWAGPFLRRLGLSLNLKPILVKVCYWEEEGQRDAAAAMPCLSYHDERHRFFGVPAHEYPGLFKFCLHAGVPVDPNNRDAANGEESVGILQEAVSRQFKTLKPQPAIVENCMYTMTPDDHFILDKHPEHANIVIGAGFSGHGFKLGPVVGEILRDLVLGKTPPYDLKSNRIHRFLNSTSSI